MKRGNPREREERRRRRGERLSLATVGPVRKVLWSGFVAIRFNAEGNEVPDPSTLTRTEDGTARLAWDFDQREIRRVAAKDRRNLKPYERVARVEIVEVPSAIEMIGSQIDGTDSFRKLRGGRS